MVSMGLVVWSVLTFIFFWKRWGKAADYCYLLFLDTGIIYSCQNYKKQLLDVIILAPNDSIFMKKKILPIHNQIPGYRYQKSCGYLQGRNQVQEAGRNTEYHPWG